MPSAVGEALELVPPGGAAGFGSVHRSRTTPLDRRLITRKQLAVLGSSAFSAADLVEYLHTLPQLLDHFPLPQLITTFPLMDAQDAIDAARSGTVAKAVLVPSTAERALGRVIAGAKLNASASLRKRIARREQLAGSFVLELPARGAIECYALAGFDFVVLDLEHSAVDLGLLSALIAACDAAEIGCVVRVQAGDLSSIARILDMGPGGVMVPESLAAEAAEAVAAARYHPVGHRGLAPIVRHELLARSARAQDRDAITTIIVQLEAAEAVSDAAAVASTPGVDVVFVGPYDLSQSVGHPGDLDHHDVVDAGERLAERIAPHAALGVYLERSEQVARWRAAGASFFTLRTDGRIFLDACRRTREQFAVG